MIRLEDSSGAPHPMANGGNAPGGVSVHDTHEEDDPGTWDTRTLGGKHRRPKTRETKVWAGMRRGSRRGPIRAMTRGNEVTPDPAEQRGLAPRRIELQEGTMNDATTSQQKIIVAEGDPNTVDLRLSQ